MLVFCRYTQALAFVVDLGREAVVYFQNPMPVFAVLGLKPFADTALPGKESRVAAKT
jgi:hypothetical protein